MSKNNCENDELEIGENSRVGDHEIPRVIIIKNLEMELGKNWTQLVKVSYWRLARVLSKQLAKILNQRLVTNFWR